MAQLAGTTVHNGNGAAAPGAELLRTKAPRQHRRQTDIPKTDPIVRGKKAGHLIPQVKAGAFLRRYRHSDKESAKGSFYNHSFQCRKAQNRGLKENRCKAVLWAI